MDLTPKQQTSEAIRQAEAILIMTGQHPSVDQVSAAIALSMILRKFGKKVSTVISDNLPQSVQQLDAGIVERNLGGLRDFVLKLDVSRAQVDKLQVGEVVDGKLPIYVTPFKGGFAPSDVTFDYGEANFEYDLAIVLGVPTRARIDRVYERNLALFDNIPLVNLDFHRSNENYGAVNLIEPNASSLCEMLVATSESLQSGLIDAEIGTALLMGIVAATDRFTAAHTTPKSLTVAAQMMAAGARQQAVVRSLYRDGKGGERTGDRGSERGADRGSERSTDRGGDRTDRTGDRGNERGGDRTGDRGNERGADRGERTDRSQHNGAAPRATAAPRVEPRPEPRTEAPMAQREVVPAPAIRPESEPEIDTTPIIPPSHIELSDPEAEPVQAPPLMVQSVIAPAPVPMADFSAAAEVLMRPYQAEPDAPATPDDRRPQ